LAELEIHIIRFGDASVRLVAAVRPGMIEIVIEQEAGGIPVTVLLEPYVTPGLANPSPATVDGQPATLTPQAADYGTIIPVQLVLDDVRTVVLGGDSGG